MIRESVVCEFCLAELECPNANLGPVIIETKCDKREQRVDQMDAEKCSAGPVEDRLL
jgi:hypothetical protein